MTEHVSAQAVLAAELRNQAATLRKNSTPLATLIPLLQASADALEKTDEEAQRELQRITNQRDIAIDHLAAWVAAINVKGSGWDDWDEHYKSAANGCDGSLNGLMDPAIKRWEDYYE